MFAGVSELAQVCVCVCQPRPVKKEVHTMNQLLQEEHNAYNTIHTHTCAMGAAVKFIIQQL